jgi:hypothetical protein
VQHEHALNETLPMQHMKYMSTILKTYDTFMQQCLVIMHDDAHDQVLAAFNVWDVTGLTQVGLNTHAPLDVIGLPCKPKPPK